MTKSKFETSKESGNHHKLAKLAGKWEGITKTWFEPGKLADESVLKGTMKLVLGGKYVIHEYSGTMQGKPYEGISIYAYDLNEDRFESVNIDSFHTGTFIMMQSGKANSGNFSALGEYRWIVSPEEIQKWGWRTEINIAEDDNVIITT